MLMKSHCRKSVFLSIPEYLNLESVAALLRWHTRSNAFHVNSLDLFGRSKGWSNRKLQQFVTKEYGGAYGYISTFV